MSLEHPDPQTALERAAVIVKLRNLRDTLERDAKAVEDAGWVLESEISGSYQAYARHCTAIARSINAILNPLETTDDS